MTVTTTADTADGDTGSFDALLARPGPDAAISLRESILASNAMSGTAALRILFDIPTGAPGYSAAAGTWTITLGGRALPALARGNLTIDGASQPGPSGHPRIVLDGLGVNEPNGPSNGITITSSGNTVRGLAIMNLYDNGVLISGPGAANNHLAANYIGPNASGGASEQANWIGVKLGDGAHDNIVGGGDSASRNLISGNGHSGILIDGPTTHDNIVANNWIGTSRAGTAALPNPVAGILISGGAHDNTVGGVGQGNLISGNGVGVYLDGALATTIAGNTIGLAADRHAPLGNADGGVFVLHGSSGNLIGGDSSAARNLISGNGSAASAAGQGISISDAGSNGNRVYGNYIGVDSSGVKPAGNYRQGVLIGAGAQNNQIGSAAPGTGNVIAYNGLGGVRIDAPSNLVAGNLIGVGADGATRLGNQFNGVRVGGDDNTVGPGNTIAYNQQSGVVLTGGSNAVLSNTIVANGRSGICVAGVSANVRDNIIQQNGASASSGSDCAIRGGVLITDTDGALLTGNSILSNVGAGVTIYQGSGNSLLGNSISDNSTSGIALVHGGNQQLAPPRIDAINQQAISGIACALCRVEVFTDTGDEGRHFAGATTAGADGSFSFQLSAAQNDPHVTATHTDGNGNTSPFTAPAAIPSGGPAPPPISLLYLPSVYR